MCRGNHPAVPARPISFRPLSPAYRNPQLAQRWLALALAAGCLFGAAQQLRGAHFMSHPLSTACICWVAAWAVHAVWPDRKEAW